MTLKHHWGYMYISPLCAQMPLLRFSLRPCRRQTRGTVYTAAEGRNRPVEPEENCRAESVFFGGGTPSLLEGEELAGLMEKIKAAFPRKNPDWEVTWNATPDGDRG